jgi:AbiTii
MGHGYEVEQAVREFTLQLITDIINLAVTNKSPVCEVLRKCLVLAYELDNSKLKDWIDKELDGYDLSDELPDYRKIRIVSKGFFIGPMGSTIRDQPLAAHVLDRKHRHWVEVAELRQPIASYDELNDPKGDHERNPRIEWPASLTTHYQQKFMEDFVLNRAWQELPLSAILALLDTVRNRTLRFALEIGKELVLSHNDISQLQAEKIDQIVTNNIFGGNVFIAAKAQDITQIGSIVVSRNDVRALAMALETVGIDKPDIEALRLR